MKTMILVFLLLSVFFTLLVAQPARLSREEEDRRSKELTALSEQFKKETGFQGYISFSIEAMKFQTFSGNFSDIIFPAIDDTLQASVSFDRVVDKILPFTKATRDQLTKGSIERLGDTIGVSYIQRINGYPIESGGRLRISYRFGQKELKILNGTINVDPSTLAAEPVITEDKIKEIFYDMIGYTEEYLLSLKNKGTHVIFPKFNLMYCIDWNAMETPDVYYPRTYRLAWKIVYGLRLVIVDAVSGEILVDEEVQFRRDYGNESGRGSL